MFEVKSGDMTQDQRVKGVYTRLFTSEKFASSHRIGIVSQNGNPMRNNHLITENKENQPSEL